MRYTKPRDSVRDISAYLDQQSSDFQRKMDVALGKVAKESDQTNQKLREELREGLQSIRNEVEYRFNRLETLLLKMAGERGMS